MSNIILITRPKYDDTTHYLFYWCKKPLQIAKSKNIKILDLPEKRANKKEVESMLNKQNPELVIINGHGNENIVTGHNHEPLLIAGENEHLLKNKIVYAISCKSAKILGPKSIDAGAKTYIGYDEDFIFVYDHSKMTHPEDDDTAKLFLEPSSELIISLIKGNSTEESCKRSQQFFKTNMKKLLSSETSKEDTTLARYLWWDMKHQICCGDPQAKFE